MKNKIIEIKKTITFYKCSECEYESPNKDSTDKHIYKNHWLSSLKKEVRLFGNSVVFSSEEQANNFINNYAISRFDYDNEYESSIEWKGPGKYAFTTTLIRDFHHQSDNRRLYKLEFYKLS